MRQARGQGGALVVAVFIALMVCHSQLQRLHRLLVLLLGVGCACMGKGGGGQSDLQVFSDSWGFAAVNGRSLERARWLCRKRGCGATLALSKWVRASSPPP